MNFKQKIIGVLLAIVALFGGGYTASNLGSIQDGQAYTSTTTYSKLGVPTFTTTQQIKTYGGTLGSVVITGAVAGRMVFMDATSTTDVSSTTISVFPASTAANTYVLDAAFGRGLIVESVSALQPTTTITWR